MGENRLGERFVAVGGRRSRCSLMLTKNFCVRVQRFRATFFQSTKYTAVLGSTVAAVVVVHFGRRCIEIFFVVW